MPILPAEKLRLHAETALKEGSAPATKGWSTGVGTLSLLHELASTPARVDEALKLLHELQVHQVELDLQHEQLEATRRELTEESVRYKELYEYAPAGYFSVALEGQILEANAAGAELVGFAPDVLRGRLIQSLLVPASRPVVNNLLNELRDGARRSSGEVHSASINGSRRLLVVATVPPSGGSFLLIFVAMPDRGEN
jgi:PAS domain S-box-containing protein